MESINYHYHFFEGETTNNMGGAGFTLDIYQSHSFCFKMGCGPSTNTRAELLVLWALLVFVVYMGFPSLFVRGDFSVVINWKNSKVSLSKLNLDYWCDIIMKIKQGFLLLDFRHVYREHNGSVDCLSKEALNMKAGLLSFSELIE